MKNLSKDDEKLLLDSLNALRDTNKTIIVPRGVHFHFAPVKDEEALNVESFRATRIQRLARIPRNWWLQFQTCKDIVSFRERFVIATVAAWKSFLLLRYQ